MRAYIRPHLLLLLCLITGRYTAVKAAGDSTRLQELKFELIKAAVVFYSADDKLHLHQRKPDCEGVKTLAELQDCAKSLTGVAGKISDFNRVPVPNKAALLSLKEHVLEAVSSKEYRKELEGYDHFKKDLDEVIDKAPEDQPVAAVSPMRAAGQQFTTSAIVPVSIAPTLPDQPALENGLNRWNIIAMALSIFTLLLLLVHLFTGKSVKKRRAAPSTAAKASISASSGSDNSFLYDQLNSKYNALHIQIEELKRQSRHPESSWPPAPPAKVQDAYAQQQSHAITKYAKTPDGNAFDVSMLSDMQDNKKIYELTIEESGKGTFKVTTNKEAQLFALEDPNNYLRNACSYHALPSHNSTIITDMPGIIELNGSRWQIVVPAKIDFS